MESDSAKTGAQAAFEFYEALKKKEQTEQFILVNSTKPLPKGLIYELLPGTEATLLPPATPDSIGHIGAFPVSTETVLPSGRVMSKA